VTIGNGAAYVAATGPGQFTGNVSKFDAVTGDRAGGKEMIACSLAGGTYGLWVAGCPNVQKLSTGEANPRFSANVVIPFAEPASAANQRESLAGMAQGEGAVWVIGDAADRRLWRIDPLRHRITATIALGFPPGGVAVGNGGVWVTDELGDRVVRIDPATGRAAAEIPVGPLVTEAPLYRRPYTRRATPPEIDPATLPDRDPLDCLHRLLASPDLASKRWIWEQYDHLVQGNTVKRPGGDAAVIRVSDSGKALAVKTDATPRYCHADPERGGMQAVAESWRNLTAVGALPLALTDNMNFGNPEKPEIMGEFVGVIEGMRQACLALDYPVVSGNVSLYNETSGSAILPTPVIGGVGLIADVSKAVDLALKRDGDALILIGDTSGHLGASLYLREIETREVGPPPPVDLAAEKCHGGFVRGLIEQRLVAACHDVSDGGLLVAIAEMAMAGDRGVALDTVPSALPRIAWWFGEDQARYLVETGEPDRLLTLAQQAGVPARRIGTVRGDGSAAELTLSGPSAISVAELRAANEAWLPGYMAQA